MYSITITKEHIGEFFGWAGNVFSIIFFSAPIFSIIKLIKNEAPLSTIPAPLFAFSILNCLLWTSFGILSNQSPVYICNSIGASLTSIWIIIYLFFLVKKRALYYIATLFIMFDLIFQLLFFCFYIGSFSAKHEKGISYMAMVVNVIMYAAPGEKIYTVIKTNNYKLLPIASSVAALFNSFSWFMYGLINNEIGIIVPNVLGMLLALMQLGVFGYSYMKFKQEGIIEIEERKGPTVDEVDKLGKPIIKNEE